jgi:hypothetical protein
MVYVLNKFGKPLMPCSSRKARILLSEKKAKVISKTPFTIKLLYGSTGYKQQVVAGLDTGSVVVGCAATANGKVVYQSEVTLRNDISKKMTERASFRRTRRGRKTRYRKARFSNRCASHRKGRLPPSIKSKIDSHIREVRFVESILPITQWNFELASFDIHKITNPDVSGKDYQNGLQKDFYNIKSYILHRDNYKCQSSQKINHSKKLHVHHIHFRSNGGSDTPSNLITLCDTCHENLHNGKFELKGKKSKTKDATETGVIKSQLSKCSVKHQVTYGYETKFKREQYLKWDKTHANDAIAICISDGEVVQPMNTILIKNHISKGDYKQTSGSHSERKIPTGKLFGLRKGDKVSTSKGIGFIKGKRSSGYFSISDLDNNIIHASEKVKHCIRITARTTTQIEELNLTKLILRRQQKELQMQKTKKSKPVIALQSATYILDATRGKI